MTHGARKWPGRGEARVWKWLLVFFAGSYAQAFASRRSLWLTFKHSGKLDLEEAVPAVAWQVRRGYVRTRMEALRRVHAATLAFLLFRWDAIERVVGGLLKDVARRVRTLARIGYLIADCVTRRLLPVSQRIVSGSELRSAGVKAPRLPPGI